MKFKSYNGEIKTATAQILDVFNDIVIERRDKTIKVPCVYGNRSRILKSLENYNKTITVPLISLSKQSVSRDTTRVSDLQRGTTLQTTPGQYNVLLDTPQPIIIEFALTIITRYEDDMDQIVSNFATMFKPDIYVVWDNPRKHGTKIKSQIVWDGSLSFEYPTDISETDKARIVVTTSFQYKSWLFPGTQASDDDSGPLIKKINFCPSIFEVGEDGYMLDRWYDVPKTMSMTEYKDNIVLGLIKAPNYDYLPMFGLSGKIEDAPELLTCISGDVQLSGDNIYTYSKPDNGYIITRNIYNDTI